MADSKNDAAKTAQALLAVSKHIKAGLEGQIKPAKNGK